MQRVIYRLCIRDADLIARQLSTGCLKRFICRIFVQRAGAAAALFSITAFIFTFPVSPAAHGRRVQDVWTKRWTEGTDSDRIKAQEEAIQSAYREKRKEIEAAKRARQAAEEKRIPTQLSKAPGRLASKTPTAWKQMLEEAGEKVVPLSRGHFKGVPYEEGGGWKVNFGGNGILSFHPAEHSHHKGAYYKISTPKEGTRRYDLNGIEIKG